jgi:hypothetical protein
MAREEGADLIITGEHYHPSFQQIAFMDQKTGEWGERRLNHSDGEAERFYSELKERGVSVRVGMETTVTSRVGFRGSLGQSGRKGLLELLDPLDPKIAELIAAIEQEAKKRAAVLLLMTNPGVRPITGLVYVLVIVEFCACELDALQQRGSTGSWTEGWGTIADWIRL